ncbi:MAG: zf-HC2 domain-containing protein [Acidobacteriaceae bacterium]
MKCDHAQQSIVQYIYGELSDEQCHSLEIHIAGCETCRGEMHAYQSLRQTLSVTPVEEPSPNFLAQSRVRLDNALDLLPPSSLRMRVEVGWQGFLAQLRAAPGMAMAIAIVGLGIGASAGHYWKHELAHRPATQVAAATIAAQTTAAPSVFNVSEIVQHPNTDMVEVHFNTMVPATVEGSIDDPEVQKLLLMATHNAVDAKVQSHSVALLAAQCEVGHFCDDGPVRTALMVALRYDREPAVRLEALDGLKPYVGQDVRVRDAVLESLMHDPSKLVRSHAIQMLEPVQADSSVRMVLQTVSTGDNNPAIREASLKVLQAIPPTE